MSDTTIGTAWGQYTYDQLEAAFDLLPTDPSSWKMPIRGTVPAGSDTDAMSAAISFFCGSWSEFVEQPDGSFTVEAPGYYMSVGS